MIPIGVTPRVRAAALLSREWDAVVVGAGIGGLACAALLGARAGKRVLVLERHHEIGGLTQSFRRKRHAWEVGVHYVGEMGEGRFLRLLIDAMTRGRLRWARLPHRHDHLIAPGIDARLGGDRAALRAQWLALAPGEERAADRILDAIVDATRTAVPHFLGRARAGPPSTQSPFFVWSDRVSADVLAECGASPRLATLATYTWTNYGSPPAESSFAALAASTAHYFDGAFHPVGGGAALGRAVAETIDAANGAIVVCAEVARAIVRGRCVSGVVLADGTEVRAPIVISDVGARSTFERLAPEDAEGRECVDAIGTSSGHVGFYVGLSRDPRELGLDGANLFVVRDPPGDGFARDLSAFVVGRASEPTELFVSSACAIDPTHSARFPGRSAITAAAPAHIDDFARFEGTRHAHRDADYVATKARMADGVMALLARHVPTARIDHVEVSTPLSTRHFTGHARGEIYGLASTPIRFRRAPGPHTAIAGLYLTGQDVWMSGIAGAIAGGLLSASAIAGRDLASELFRARG